MKITIYPLSDLKTLYRELGLECRDFVKAIVGGKGKLEVFWVDQRCNTREYLREKLLGYLASSLFHRSNETRNYSQVYEEARSKYTMLISRFAEDHVILLAEIGMLSQRETSGISIGGDPNPFRYPYSSKP